MDILQVGGKYVCVFKHTHTHPDLHLNQDLVPGIFLPVWFAFLGWHPWAQIRGENTLEGSWAASPCCDCFSCCVFHSWFKYLMTLIKQHLNFPWDPVSVALDHIMRNNGWNEPQGEAVSPKGLLQLLVTAVAPWTERPPSRWWDFAH